MDNSASIRTPRPGVSSLTPVRPAHLDSGEEHIALLRDAGRFGVLRRWDDLFDEDVAAVFGLADGEAELLALCFDAGKFTPVGTAAWLAERGFTPLHFVPNSGKVRLGQHLQE